MMDIKIVKVGFKVTMVVNCIVVKVIKVIMVNWTGFHQFMMDSYRKDNHTKVDFNLLFIIELDSKEEVGCFINHNYTSCNIDYKMRSNMHNLDLGKS